MSKSAKKKSAKKPIAKKPIARAPAEPEALPRDEAAEIEALLAALAPIVATGVSHHRIGSAAGVHPEDMKGFLEGRVTLTAPLRERLRDQIPNLVRQAPADPAED